MASKAKDDTPQVIEHQAEAEAEAAPADDDLVALPWEQVERSVMDMARDATITAAGERAPRIYGALWNVMRDVGWVGKSGHMSQGGNYDYRTVEDVQAALGLAFRQHGVALGSSMPFPPSYTSREGTSSSGKPQVTTDCRLVIAYTFTSLVDGSQHSITAAGEGRDVFDKSTSKAMTAALKYALCQATLLPTFDPDPDGEAVPALGEGAAAPGPETAAPGPGASAGPEDPDPAPGEVLTAIRGADTIEELTEIREWLAARDALDMEVERTTFEVHLDAARQALGMVPQ